jgi:uncharacterized protein YbaP (TraB family)
MLCALTAQAQATNSAQAVHSAHPDQPFVITDEPNLLEATSGALRNCQAAYAGNGYCELTRVNGRPVTPASAIKARVPEQRHPLYLWEYKTASATVYLAGSVHILKQGLYPLPRQLDEAFAVADRLVLEIDSSQYTPQQLQSKVMQFGLLPTGQTLDQVLDADLYAQLDVFTRQFGLPLAQLAMLKPALVTQQLAVLALSSIGYDPTIGVEQYFTAQANGKTILELESMDFQLDLLMNQPMDIQVQMVRDTLDQMDDFDSVTADLMAAWFSGDDALFQQAFDAQSGASELSAEFLRELMDKRNVGMVAKIEQYLQSEGTYLVLVGAAHFIGDKGIIALLEDKGIKGRRIHSDERI